MWKSNWEETKQNFTAWWNRDGLVVGMWGGAGRLGAPHEAVEPPRECTSVEEFYTNGKLRAQRNHYQLSRQSFPADLLPVSDTEIGPGSLALFCGSEPGFSRETVWFEPCMRDCADPEKLPPLRFDASSRWWKVTEETLKACAELGRGKYLVGCPDLVENVDIISALRDPQTLMMDMADRPEWVEQKVREINQIWFEAYDRIYDIIKLEDGSSTFGAFRVWGPGKTAKVQCDACAMFSPAAFERFVVPSLTEQCEWLDFSMYHLDGTQCICHLDLLLSIAPLDAIEWTPQAGIESGGHARWHPLYRRILEAGKSVQVMEVRRDEIAPLLDAIGTKGVYFMTPIRDEADAEEVARIVERYRP